jgi:hypothetical protein
MTVSNFSPSKDFKYDISLRVKGGKYSMKINELYIKSSGDSLEETFKNIVTREKEIRDEYEMIGALDDLPAPRANFFSTKRKLAEYKVFFLKLLTIFAFLMLVFGVMGSVVKNQMEVVNNQMERVSSQVTFFLVKEKLVNTFISLSNTKMESERKELLISSARKFVAKYKPIVDEVRLLFKDE